MDEWGRMDKEERFKKQQEILKRMERKDKKYKWSDNNHAVFTKKPALTPQDRTKR